MKIAIIIFGPPGSGKGTQAKLLADKLGLIHFDTGKLLEQIVHNPANARDKKIQRERKFFDSGVLLTPSWVLKILNKKSQEIAKSGFGVVFSGSPRTLYEFVGEKKQKGLIDVLEKNYGKKNIFIFKLEVPERESIKRNSSRIICTVCGTQILSWMSGVKYQMLKCPFCGGNFYRRTLDNTETIKVRLKEYRERTLPVIKALEKRGYKVVYIGGKSLPSKVHENIMRKMRKNG